MCSFVWLAYFYFLFVVTKTFFSCIKTEIYGRACLQLYTYTFKSIN
jgi:hypothetical protein